MASSKAYLDYVLDQLSALEEIRCRGMMGEYVLYHCGRVVGGIYDDRLLLKPTPGAVALMEASRFGVRLELPYPGAKELLLADVDDRVLTCDVVRAVSRELPAPKPKPSKTKRTSQSKGEST